MTAGHAADLLGAAMVDFAAGGRTQAWLRVAPGRPLAHDLAAYFAPVTAHEQALLDLVEGPVLDVGCGPARHARLLQARGLTVVGLDRSLLALELARSLGLRHWLHADALSGSLPSVRTALLLDGNLGLAGTPEGAVRLLHRLAMACGPGGQLLVGGRAPAMGGCGPWSSGTSTGSWSDPGGGGCRPASRPSSTWPTRPAGASSTPSPRVPATGPPFPSTPLGSSAGSPWPGVVPRQPGARGTAARRGHLRLLEHRPPGLVTGRPYVAPGPGWTPDRHRPGLRQARWHRRGCRDGQRQAERAHARSAVDPQQRAGTRRPCRPSGAAMAADGTVCAAISDATAPNDGFATLRCTNGLVVDLEAFQAQSKLPSNPYDVVSDGRDGWHVSDGAANNVLHVD